MSAALFCLGNISLLWLVSWWAARIATRRLDFVVGLAALYPLCAALTVLVGGLTHQLSAPRMALAPLLIVVVLTAAFGRGNLLAFVERVRLPRSPAVRVAALCCIAFASFPLVRAMTAGTGYFIDDFGYHTVAVASWIQGGGFGQIMPQFTAYLPLNGELLPAWFALPYHHDGAVVLASLVWFVLAAVAAGGLVRLGGGDAAASLFTAAAVMAAPPIVWQTRTFSATDVAGAAALLAALYFAVAAMKERRLSQAVVAGLLGGFAAGTKATFLPVAVLICLYPLCLPLRWRTRWSFFAAISASTAVLGSVWYLKNWAVTGNPLFPAQLGPFAGPLTRGEQADIKLIGLIAQVPWTPRLWGHMIYDYLDWPIPLGVLAVAGYIRGLAVEWLRGASRSGEETALRRLLWVCGVAQFVLHLFAPFCLGGGYVDGRIEVYSRYIMPWFLFGLVLAAPLLDSRSRFAWYWRALLIAGLAMCWPGSGIMRFGGFALAVAGLGLLRWLPGRAWRPLVLASCVALFPMIALLQPRMRAASGQNLREHLRTAGGGSLGEALLSLETLPPGTRLTRFANHAYLNSPLFGPDWQFTPIFTHPDGRALQPLHVEFRDNPALTFYGGEARELPGARDFVANLHAAGITHVFITKFGATAWPPQQGLLEESRAATPLFNDGDSALWHLLPPPVSAGPSARAAAGER